MVAQPACFGNFPASRLYTNVTSTPFANFLPLWLFLKVVLSRIGTLCSSANTNATFDLVSLQVSPYSQSKVTLDPVTLVDHILCNTDLCVTADVYDSDVTDSSSKCILMPAPEKTVCSDICSQVVDRVNPEEFRNRLLESNLETFYNQKQHGRAL